MSAWVTADTCVCSVSRPCVCRAALFHGHHASLTQYRREAYPSQAKSTGCQRVTSPTGGVTVWQADALDDRFVTLSSETGPFEDECDISQLAPPHGQPWCVAVWRFSERPVGAEQHVLPLSLPLKRPPSCSSCCCFAEAPLPFFRGVPRPQT